jgi:hypothetical protein
MALIRVTATIEFTYDTDDGLVTDTESAVDDVKEGILSGVNPEEFVITTTVTDAEGGVIVFEPGTVWMDPETGEFGRY